MLAQSTGMNDSQGNVQDSIFDALAQAEAADISALLQAQFDKRILAVEFPSQPPVAYFELAAEDREDVNALADRAVKFSTAGFDADETELSERAGMKLRKKAVIPPGITIPAVQTAPLSAPLANRATPAAKGRDVLFRTATMSRVGQAMAQDMAPITDRLAALADIEDEAAFRAAWAKFEVDLPQLQKQVLTESPAAADALAEAIGTALVSGMAEAAFDHNSKKAK
jgi:hypothetical protein